MKRTNPEVVAPLTCAQELRSLAIAKAVFAEVTPERLLDVDAVLAGRGTPRLSRIEREEIEAAAKRIAEKP
jgi:hypothetical protein